MMTQAITYLRTNLLHNTVLLKMLHAFGTVIHTTYSEEGDSRGVLLLLPTQAFSYDAKTYPDVDFTVLLSTTDAAASQRLLPQIPKECQLVFKLMDAHDQAIVAQHFPLRRVRAFHSYTSRPGSHFQIPAGVQVSNRVDRRCYPLYAEQGYDAAEVDGYFAQGESVSSTLYRDQIPLASCFTYLNYDPIWEIGGVYTLPAERRKGYAAKVVEAALYALIERGRVPRYQVHEDNLASIAVAESLGLQRYVTLTHWRYSPGQ